MKSIVLPALLFLATLSISAQNSIQGLLIDDQNESVVFANVGLYQASDSSLVKVETSDAAGIFKFHMIPEGNYYLHVTYVGFKDLYLPLAHSPSEVNLGEIQMEKDAIELQETVVRANKRMVEVKPDRTVFNVQGAVNSAGSDAIELLRKAPAVTLDNNDNISVLGRAGVQIYINGKRLPLSGDDLTSYLRSLKADQIEKIDIITNPGAKYDAEGNAGIIDIILIKDKNLGTNGSVGTTFSQGKYARWDMQVSANHRTKKTNIYGSVGGGLGNRFNKMNFEGSQNGFYLVEDDWMKNKSNQQNLRIGTDFFIHAKHTIGLLFSYNRNFNDGFGKNNIVIHPDSDHNAIDSTLLAFNESESSRGQQAYNLNYQFAPDASTKFNFDLDYGAFDNKLKRHQPNYYYKPISSSPSSTYIDDYDSPSDIDIFSTKLDFEHKFQNFQLGLGGKYTDVNSDNIFKVYNVFDSNQVLDTNRTNEFLYIEKVVATYGELGGSIGKKIQWKTGLRMEQTNVEGSLTTFNDQEDERVKQNYLNWFPNLGLSWSISPQHVLSASYGKRINRPDYNVLNPFRNQLSQLSYESGNPFLKPEIVHNYELNYTFMYSINFKIGYSNTEDQITRLIGPSEDDPRASFITWENLSNQKIWSGNISLPYQINKKWDFYMNFSASHIHNEANYENGATVDLKAFSYNFYGETSVLIFQNMKFEVSGYYSGPGIWGGVFEYDPSWSLSVGLQKKFFNDALTVKISGDDLFYQSPWSGHFTFNGLTSMGRGSWDSRRFNLNLRYTFGNKNIKSRKRSTGIESEKKRAKSNDN